MIRKQLARIPKDLLREIFRSLFSRWSQLHLQHRWNEHCHKLVGILLVNQSTKLSVVASERSN